MFSRSLDRFTCSDFLLFLHCRKVTMSSSSLSSVVSNLVRAQMGTSVSSTVTDEELDRHVAELILKEAKQKAERYLQEGVRAYLPDKECVIELIL